MAELLHPGVYVQEVPSAVRPIEGVSTSTAAVVGVAEKGPVPGTSLPTGRMAQPVLVTSLTEYHRVFGGFLADSFLTYAVRAFFENGGRPVTSPPSPVQSAASAASAALAISAANPGEWGNRISVRIAASSDGDPNNFKLIVLEGGAPVEAFDAITFQGSPTLAPTATNPAEYGRSAVNTRSEYIAITADFTARPGNGTIQLANGNDGPPTVASEFIGAPATDSTVT